MLKLEEIAKDAQITGLVPDEVVKVVNVEEIGPSARLVAYRNAQGKLDEQTIFRHDEHRLSLAVAGKAWAFDAEPAAFKLALEAYRISLAQIVPDALPEDWQLSKMVRELAPQMGADEVQLYYSIVTQAREQLHLAPDPQAGFTMMLLRLLAFVPEQFQADSAKK